MDDTTNNNNNNITKESIEGGQPTTIEQQQQQQQQHSTMEPARETQKDFNVETTNERLKEAASITSPTQTEREDKELDEKKRQIKSAKNPFENLTPRVTQLVYWENPTHSGALLTIGFLFLFYIANYSLFNTFCALATTLIGVNWIYVIGRKQLQSLINQKPVNPHEHLLVNKPWYIEREEVEKYLDVTIEAVNFVLLEVQKIVLVDDSMRTIRYVFMFYVLWTLGTWVSLRTLFGIGLVLSFVTPIAYQKNKELVDEKLYQAKKCLHSYLDRGLNIAKQHTGGIYEKAKSFAATKGLVVDTKKEE